MSVATVSPISPAIQSVDLISINTIRTLSMDAVQAANSGHPGTPMALAPVAYCLWQQSFASIPEILYRLTAIGSCYRQGTPPCCSIRCFT